MPQTQDAVVFGQVRYVPAAALARTHHRHDKGTTSELGFAMHRCAPGVGPSWHQIVEATISPGGLVHLRLTVLDGTRQCEVLIAQDGLLDVRAVPGLSVEQQIQAAHDVLSATHPSTHFDIGRRPFSQVHEQGLRIQWLDGPSTETVASVLCDDRFARTDLHRRISEEHASLLQLLIWSWHDGHAVNPTQQEFSDVYDTWAILGVEQFSAELRDLNRSMCTQARAAGVHPHTWARQHGPAALREQGITGEWTSCQDGTATEPQG